MKIFIMGPSGAGTTTLGKALARELNLRHEDSDNFFWEQTEPPFTTPRDAETLHRLFYQYTALDSFVLSGDVLNWGIPDEYPLQCFSHVIYVYAPWEIRKARIHARESMRFGQRIEEGGDMNANYLAFIEWASQYESGLLAGRNMISQRSYVEKLRMRSRQVLELLGSLSPEESLRSSIQFLRPSSL